MPSDILDKVTSGQLKKKAPSFAIGDTVDVRIRECRSDDFRTDAARVAESDADCRKV